MENTKGDQKENNDQLDAMFVTEIIFEKIDLSDKSILFI
jgi:hypothetical protein